MKGYAAIHQNYNSHHQKTLREYSREAAKPILQVPSQTSRGAVYAIGFFHAHPNLVLQSSPVAGDLLYTLGIQFSVSLVGCRRG